MSLLADFANKVIGPAITRGGDQLMNAAINIPGTAAEKEIKRLHDEWMRTAQLGVRYYTPASRYEWIGDDCGQPMRLTCSPTWVFTRQTRSGLYTDSHTHSYQAFLIAGFQGLTIREPAKPKHPGSLKVTWELEYVEEPALV